MCLLATVLKVSIALPFNKKRGLRIQPLNNLPEAILP